MSINYNDLIAEIEEIAPRELEEEWDNSGMQIQMGKKEVHRVLVVLEITKKVIDEAKQKKIDFIITHHPLMFHKIDVIDYNTITGSYIIDLIQSGISVYSAHTTFDEAFGGNNEYMAELIGLSRVRKLKEIRPFNKTKPIGRMGNFREACTLVEACKIVEEALGITGQIKAVGVPNKLIKTVGLCTGAGGDAMELAALNGCDLFITGDIRHHEAQTALEKGLCLIDAGHYGTEHIFAENFAEKLRKNIGHKIDILESEVNVNPFKSMIE
ncbi:MAG: Nif3-like dinuclear metal center hexameric protein [Anaerovoracaceae bacterium]|jgi:dinuclear metal center YbgI/SA1388 family protein